MTPPIDPAAVRADCERANFLASVMAAGHAVDRVTAETIRGVTTHTEALLAENAALRAERDAAVARVAELEAENARLLTSVADWKAGAEVEAFEGDLARARVADLEAAAEWMLGDWANVKTRDAMRKVLSAKAGKDGGE